MSERDSARLYEEHSIVFLLSPPLSVPSLFSSVIAIVTVAAATKISFTDGFSAEKLRERELFKFGTFVCVCERVRSLVLGRIVVVGVVECLFILFIRVCTLLDIICAYESEFSDLKEMSKTHTHTHLYTSQRIHTERLNAEL